MHNSILSYLRGHPLPEHGEHLHIEQHHRNHRVHLLPHLSTSWKLHSPFLLLLEHTRSHHRSRLHPDKFLLHPHHILPEALIPARLHILLHHGHHHRINLQPTVRCFASIVRYQFVDFRAFLRTVDGCKTIWHTSLSH